jgi:hypothetical protein
MSPTTKKMISNASLVEELKACKGEEGFNAIDGIFEQYGFGRKSYKDKTAVLYSIMGIIGGGGTPNITDKKIYILAKDLLASRDWERFTHNSGQRPL